MKQDFAFIKEQENKMRKLIRAALDKYDADELVEWLHQETKGNGLEYLDQKMIGLAVQDGYVLVKCPSLNDKDKIEEFVQNNIYTSYNEQQANLFAY